MSKLRSAVLCFFFVFSISLFGQQSYLVSINLDKVQNPEKLEKLKIPVYHIFEHNLVTSISKELLEELTYNKIEYDILDKSSGGEHYYILSKRNRNALTEYTGVVLYKAKNSFLVKGSDISESVKDNFLPVELRKKPFHFRNEKVIPRVNNNLSTDSTISRVIANINADSIRNQIQGLQNFKTRFLFASNRDSVVTWIRDQFIRMGYSNAVLDSFYYDGTWQKNVVATLEGASTPEYVCVVGGHHDSYSSGNPVVFAPGADDNASGTAAVLEIARVIKQSGYIPESTIKFVTFAAEEYGLHGSYDYAAKAFASKMKIKVMLNHDMISYTNKPLNESNVSINVYTGSELFSDLAKLNTSKYSLLNPVFSEENVEYSDSYSFWVYDFPAVFFMENSFSPYYHSPKDLITYYNMEYCAEVIKASCATLISAIVTPTSAENVEVVDAGDGASLIIKWSQSKETDISKYKVYLGTESGTYNKTYETTSNSIRITGLLEGVKYYAGVSVIDQDGNESPIIEKSGIPNQIPLAPQALIDNPQFHIIEITWQKNQENDLSGYYVYRSESSDGEYLKINNELIKEPVYKDETPLNGYYYYYKIKAVDSLNNESSFSDFIRSRSVSLDQGIIVVDETADGNGTISKPDDESVDNFYRNILSGYRFSSYDIVSEGDIKLADLGAYSTVIWHGDDYSNQSIPFSKIEDLKKYLEFGGNFIYSGYKPTKAFAGNLNMDTTFSAGDFIFDLLKMSSSESVFGSRFKGAKSLKAGYNDLHIDTTKTLSSANFHLSGIEAIPPADGASGIYTFESDYDQSTSQGSLTGKPVGVEYIGADYKTVILSFPLYFIKEDDAKQLVTSILTKFNEVTGVEREKKESIPAQFNLSQNYPNPFNPVTVISYQISVGTSRLVGSVFVQLRVYDMLGREVAVLVNKDQDAGYYRVEFNGSKLSSGIYTYVLRVASPAGGATDILIAKKMILLK